MSVKPVAIQSAGELTPFGNCATHNVQTSPVDITDGAVLTVGAFGLGEAPIRTSTDANLITVSGFYWFDNTALNLPKPGGYWTLINIINDSTNTSQICWQAGTDSIMYHRSECSGVWADWRAIYDTGNKPTAGDIGAVAKNGDVMTGDLTLPGLRVLQKTANTAFVIYFGLSDGSNLGYIGQGSTDKDVHIVNYIGNNDIGLLPDGSIEIRGGSATSNIAVMGNLNPTSFTTFDTRYAKVADAYTKSVSDSRYLQGVQLGAKVATGDVWGSWGDHIAPAGHVIVGFDSGRTGDTIDIRNGYWKPIQENVNGTYKTIAG